MARKRKSEAPPRLDEADRALYSTFCGAANSLSQLYSQAMAQQKQSFHAGELHALEKFSQWIMRRQEEESRLTLPEILAHIQHEMDYGGSSDVQTAPRIHQYPQSAGQFANSSGQLSVGSHGQGSRLAPRASNSDQSKNPALFSNALSSPVRRSIQSYQPTQGAAGIGSRSAEANSTSSNDTAMDMVSDSAVNEYC